ncbi:MAG: DUF1186 domain-containing protein [Planctomycetota bacterium]|jgi:hypothetical protein
MDIDEILSTFVDKFDPPFPRTAMEAAIEQREAITPHLIRVVETALDEFLGPEERDNGFVFALYLLAHFREPAAHKPILRLFQEGREDAADATGDLVTEDLHRILADTFDGDLAGIQGLADDESGYEYTRGAAWRAEAVLACRGVTTKEAFKVRLAAGMDRALEQRDAEMAGALPVFALDFSWADLLPKIEALFRENLVDPFIAGDFDKMKHEMAHPKRLKGEPYWRRYEVPGVDAIADMEGWACWREDRGGWTDESFEELVERKWAERDQTFRALGRADTFEHDDAKVGRNDPCPCGSGAKFKKCCGR